MYGRQKSAGPVVGAREGFKRILMFKRIPMCRYELKYRISESKAAAIAQFIRPYVRLDHYCKLQPKGSYPVASLYLDSKGLQLCRESMEGRKNRFKLRIRSYTDQSNYPCFFEIKRRANAIIIKDRARVMPHNVETLLSGLSLPAQNINGDGETLYNWSGNYNGVNSGYTVENIHHAKQFGYTIWEINGLDVTMIWMERTGVGTYVVREVWSYTVLPGDLNGDGAVDFKDIAILTNNWLETKPID
jgi:hypothetical protein